MTRDWFGYFLLCFLGDHDFYNGGARCRDCWAPRPKSDPWWGRAAALKAASKESKEHNHGR